MEPVDLKGRSLADALTQLQERVRSAPGDPTLRSALFQLLSVLGQWERALQQLHVVGTLDADSSMWVRVLEAGPRCEALRAEIFAGVRTPVVMGEPEPWVAQMIEALRHDAQGRREHGAALRDEALEVATAASGRLRKHTAVAGDTGAEAGETELAFEWLGDSDSRLGPIFEVMLEGRYLWVPHSRVRSLDVAPPRDLQDLLWARVRFEWVNGGEAHGYMPVRYPGTEACEDEGLRLAKRTEWREPIRGAYEGLGQRLFFTDREEVALLDLRHLEFDHAAGE